ncbi:hypothetical protein CEXT_1331 [Caerostris extrusa]|uniref:Uncharacterized protein n=1 Tax=Caerostris extrusa TaxID=172846 RepID=A0AAV4MSH1_CAEEX|nr:hypothetical protein CEXT_1331 [Caerostris extrusa]
MCYFVADESRRVFLACSDSTMNSEEGMEFSIDQMTGPLKGQDGEPNYSVKADIPEGMCVTEEERQAKEICHNITDLEYEIAALEAHLQYNSTKKSNQDKFMKNPNNYPHYGQLCAEIQFIQNHLRTEGPGRGHVASWRRCPAFPKPQIKKDSFRQPQLIFKDHSNLLLINPVRSFSQAVNGHSTKIETTVLSPLSSPWETANKTWVYWHRYLFLKELQTILAAFPNLFEILPLMQKTENQLNKLGLLMQALATAPASNPQ